MLSIIVEIQVRVTQLDQIMASKQPDSFFNKFKKIVYLIYILFMFLTDS